MLFAVFQDSGPRAPPAVLVTALAFVAFGIYKLLRTGSRDKRLPPGPPTIPILGNLLDIPKTGLGSKSVARAGIVRY
jgi:hypothetical protein